MTENSLRHNKSVSISIKRPCYTREEFNNVYQSKAKEKSGISFKTAKTRIILFLHRKTENPCRSIGSFILSVFPILAWLPKYDVKQWLVSDIISGVTIGVMQIPQGMSNSLLAGQHPIYGLYNAFFPMIIYTFMGTSRHTSTGTFGISCLMLGTAVSTALPESSFVGNSSLSEEEALQQLYNERILFGTSTTFVAGVFLLAMSLFNLGSVVMYLSDPMVSGFTCGAAVHVIVSQLKGLLGVKVGSYSGPLNVIWVLRDLVLALTSLDAMGRTRTAATVVISVICVIFLLVVKEINERYKSKLPLGIPVPGEIIVVIVGTGISYGANLAGLYHVTIVGNIPSGLPVPSVETISRVPDVISSAIPIAIVGFSMAVSIAKIFGNNFGYKIRPNQELVAYGCSNLVVSFFYCIPAFPAMSRSCVQVDSGGKTQVVSLISASIILLVLLWIGPLFRTIPRACLASIIVVAIKGMLRKARDFKPYWKLSKLDGAVWMVSCLATVFLDVVYGLVTGVAFSMLCVVFRNQFVQADVINQVDETEIYRDVQQTNMNNPSSDLVVLIFRGPLLYVNKDRFQKAVIRSTGVDPANEKKSIEKEEDQQKVALKNRHAAKGIDSSSYNNPTVDIHDEGQQSPCSVSGMHNCESEAASVIKCLVLDCTAITSMDSVGVKKLKTITEDYNKIGISILLANVSDCILEILSASGFIENFTSDVIFLTTHDAVTWWNQRVEPDVISISDDATTSF